MVSAAVRSTIQQALWAETDRLRRNQARDEKQANELGIDMSDLTEHREGEISKLQEALVWISGQPVDD